jgi:hypothetical protein
VRKLAHEALRAALAFVQLPDLPGAIKLFLEHLGRTKDKTAPKQTEDFLAALRWAGG